MTIGGIFNPAIWNNDIFNVGAEEATSLGFHDLQSLRPTVDFVLPAPGYPQRLIEVYREVATPSDAPTEASELKELLELIQLCAAASRRPRS